MANFAKSGYVAFMRKKGLQSYGKIPAPATKAPSGVFVAAPQSDMRDIITGCVSPETPSGTALQQRVN